jgi:hypothetical protein
MLATAVYVLDMLHRALDKAGRGLAILVDVVDEAQDARRAAQRKYPQIEE